MLRKDNTIEVGKNILGIYGIDYWKEIGRGFERFRKRWFQLKKVVLLILMMIYFYMNLMGISIVMVKELNQN